MSSNKLTIVKKTSTKPGLGHHTFTSNEAEWYGSMMKSDQRIKSNFERNKYTLTKSFNPLTLSDHNETEFLVKVPESVNDSFYLDVEKKTAKAIDDDRNVAMELLHIGVLEEKRKALKAQLRDAEFQITTNRVLRETALTKVSDIPIPVETKFRITKVDYNKPIKRK